MVSSILGEGRERDREVGKEGEGKRGKKGEREGGRKGEGKRGKKEGSLCLHSSIPTQLQNNSTSTMLIQVSSLVHITLAGYLLVLVQSHCLWW